LTPRLSKSGRCFGMISNTTELRDQGIAPTGGAVHWLSLAAAPTFAIMALLTAVDGSADMICLAAQDASTLSGMVPMYMLMSAIHSAPWLKLISGRRRQP
jgi:hypothetical protein